MLYEISSFATLFFLRKECFALLTSPHHKKRPSTPNVKSTDSFIGEVSDRVQQCKNIMRFIPRHPVRQWSFLPLYSTSPRGHNEGGCGVRGFCWVALFSCLLTAIRLHSAVIYRLLKTITDTPRPLYMYATIKGLQTEKIWRETDRQINFLETNICMLYMRAWVCTHTYIYITYIDTV